MILRPLGSFFDIGRHLNEDLTYSLSGAVKKSSFLEAHPDTLILQIKA